MEESFLFLFEKRLKFYQTRSNAIILQETLPAYCILNVVRMNIGEVFYEKVYMSHRRPPRSPWNTSGRENWFQNTLNDQKLGNYLEVSNRTNQLEIQFVSERGDPLSRTTWLMCQIILKHVLLMKAKRSTLEMKHFVRERGDLLLIMTRFTSR